MKKIVFGILIVFIVAISIFLVWYNRNLQNLRDIKAFNEEFEGFLDREITGVDITTIINKAIENNNQNEIKKDSNGRYINDEKNSIEIIVKPTKERTGLSNGGV